MHFGVLFLESLSARWLADILFSMVNIYRAMHLW